MRPPDLNADWPPPATLNDVTSALSDIDSKLREIHDAIGHGVIDMERVVNSKAIIKSLEDIGENVSALHLSVQVMGDPAEAIKREIAPLVSELKDAADRLTARLDAVKGSRWAPWLIALLLFLILIARR
jgi:vacuolar-type H+-ATPase subunit I/STV1